MSNLICLGSRNHFTKCVGMSMKEVCSCLPLQRSSNFQLSDDEVICLVTYYCGKLESLNFLGTPVFEIKVHLEA
jgi:hypothetical protein